MVSNEGVEIGSEVEIKWAAHLLQLSVTGIKKARPFKSTSVFFERNNFVISKKTTTIDHFWSFWSKVKKIIISKLALSTHIFGNILVHIQIWFKLQNIF